MPRYRPFSILGAAVVIALLTSIMLYNWLNQANAKPTQVHAIKTESLAVATVDLPWGSKLTNEMIDLVLFPAGNLPDGYFHDRQSLVGRVVLVNLKRNEPILESKLAPTTVTTGGVGAVTHPDKRAMAVKVDEVIGVAGFIKPGDRVDVMVTIHQGNSANQPLTKLVLSNTLVLATGTDLERKGNDKASQVTVMTLEVTPEEAEKLALATTEGKLRLALRNPINTDVALTKGANINSLLASYRLYEKAEKSPQAAKKAEARAPESIKVELIKGGTVSNVKFGSGM